MTTDWILLRRAAAELDRALRGRRLDDAGLLDDGRVALRFAAGRGAGRITLAIDPFGSPPLPALADAELALAEPGWLRAVATALRGTRLTEVRARRGDRVVVLVFGSASRFGVATESRLALELIPRYGNVVLLRDRTVIAAAKQFSPAQNETRSVQAGQPYEPPPLPVARLDFPGFTRALEGAGERERGAALGGYLPELPRLLAASVVAETPAPEPLSAARLAAALESRARAVLAHAEAAAAEEEALHAYRDARGGLVAVHVVPLAQHAGLAHARVPALLPLFAEAQEIARRSRSGDATERRRAALATRIARRARAVADEDAALAARAGDAAERDRLRACGDALFTHAHEVPPGAASFVPPTNPGLTIPLDPELDAKENAQRYYARYRKTSDALPHVERRRAALAARREALDVLAFETERADAATLAEVEGALDELEGRPPRRAAAAGSRARPPLRIERPSGARIYVGRSPRENVEVTFRIARPDDLWFHARGIPGSHVVLQAPAGAAPDDADLDAAADLAAAHSKARRSPRVEVDYTERKYVRKQRDAAPGLVWYTNARTRVGRPAE